MKLTDLKYYDELAPSTQAQARLNVIASVKSPNGRHIAQALRAYVADRNRAINDPHHIPRLLNGQKALQKIRDDAESYLIPFIRANKLIFTSCGAYVTYVHFFTLFVKGKEYLPTPSQQTTLRDPYIDVNRRGPDYHEWLYRMHRYIIRYMIIKG